MGSQDGDVRGLAALRVILLFSLVSTVLHYAHNVVAIERYPQIDGVGMLAARVVVAAGWVLFTAAGLIGYRRYVQRRYWPAQAWLMVYSLSGLASLGHFLIGVPDISVFWFATIVTDGLAALALWVFVVWSASIRAAHIGSDPVSTEH